MTTTLEKIVSTPEAWDRLSDAARAHIRATRPHIVNRWILSESGYAYTTIEADTIEEALEEARNNVDPASYSDEFQAAGGWIDVEARNLITGEGGSDTVAVDAEEPPCADGHTHSWVGGDADDDTPGSVVSNGGGVIVTDVCEHCGRYRVTDTWAQRPDTGEQGLTSVTYEEADETSEAWLLECALYTIRDSLADYSPRVRDDGSIVLPDVAPDSDGADTSPGSAWWDECDQLLAEIEAYLPRGWSAEWVDDDIIITRD